MATTGMPGRDAQAAARLLPRDGRFPALSGLTALASRLLSTPDAPLSVQVSMLTDVQTVIAGAGAAEGSVGSASPLADSLCAVTARSGGPLEVSDARIDLRVADLPPVTSGAVSAYLGVPLQADGSIIGALCAFGPAPRAWSAYDVGLLEELATAVVSQLELQALSAEYETSRLSEVTDRRADQARAEAATRRLELLAAVSADLAASGLDAESALASLARMVVPELADWSLVSLPIGADQIKDVGSWHHDPDLRDVVDTYVKERLSGRVNQGLVHQVRQSGELVVIPEGVGDLVRPTLGSEAARQALEQLRPESVVVVPLTARGHLTGVLTLVRSAGRPAMSDAEITTVREIASRAALTLDNARLYAEQRSLAEGLQRSLLTTPPEPDHCQIIVRYVPASEAASVGGDWFDSFLQADGATVLVIGDVMGHDTVAAAAMGQVRSLLRGIAWHTGEAPAAVLSGLDAAMRGLDVNTTATAVVARLEQSIDEKQRGITKLRWSNAGHPPPMVINPDGGVAVLAGVEADLLLGIDPGTRRTESVVVLDRDATVLMYTDGLVERRGQDLDQGLALLRDTLLDLQGLSLDDLCDQLLARMIPDSPDDDVALIAVRLHRQDQPRPAEAGPQHTPPDLPEE